MDRLARRVPWAVVLVLVGAAPAGAAEPDVAGLPEASTELVQTEGDVFEAPPVELHGFVSQGFLATNENNYLAKSKRGSFEFAEAALNVTAPLTESMRAGMQLFSRDLGPLGDYEVSLDWFYLDYRFKDWLGVRAGRVKLPFGLYNDTSDIDAARTAVLLPQSVYPSGNRDFLLAQTGTEVYGYLDLRQAGALDYRVYAGTIFLDVAPTPGRPFEVADLNIPYVFGGRLLWESPQDQFRLGGSVQVLRLDTDLLYEVEPKPVTVHVEIPAVLWVGSFEYHADELLLAVEYSRWHVDFDSSDTKLVPENPTVSERFYALAALRLRPWLQPGVYYSLLFPNVREADGDRPAGRREGHYNQQHDAALTLRFDLNPHWLLKVEGHYLYGTAALAPGLNDNTPRTKLEPHWGLLLVKTTAYF